jgi:hypothetical protein
LAFLFCYGCYSLEKDILRFEELFKKIVLSPQKTAQENN